MNARPGFKLADVSAVSSVVDRFFEALGYERKRPPHLTRIVIVRVPDQPMLAPARIDSQSMMLRRSRY